MSQSTRTTRRAAQQQSKIEKQQDANKASGAVFRPWAAEEGIIASDGRAPNNNIADEHVDVVGGGETRRPPARDVAEKTRTKTTVDELISRRGEKFSSLEQLQTLCSSVMETSNGNSSGKRTVPFVTASAQDSLVRGGAPSSQVGAKNKTKTESKTSKEAKQRDEDEEKNSTGNVSDVGDEEIKTPPLMTPLSSSSSPLLLPHRYPYPPPPLPSSVDPMMGAAAVQLSALPPDVATLHQLGLLSTSDVSRWLAKRHRPKKFICDHCQAAFSNNGQLKGHVRIHTGEKRAPAALLALLNR